MPVQHVSDTARWVAFYRAMESERPDAIFRDRWARTLAGPEGERLVDTLPQARRTAWAMITRTAIFDEIITRVVRRLDADLVLNLAAGLDTRPYRLRLPHDLAWIDADFADVLAYKRETLRREDAEPICRLRDEPVDLTDADARAAVLDRAAHDARRGLVVAEGLLVYLEPDDVARLARELHARDAFRWWLVDLASPRLLTWMTRSYGRGISDDVRFRFAPEEGLDFFTALGWQPVDVRSSFHEAVRLRRTPRGAWLMRLAGRLLPGAGEDMRTMSRIVLLERLE